MKSLAFIVATLAALSSASATTITYTTCGGVLRGRRARECFRYVHHVGRRGYSGCF
jgi:hypothetical protein